MVTEESVVDTVGQLSETVGLSDGQTVGLSENCWTLSESTVGLSDRGSDYQQLSTHPQSDFLDHTAEWVGQQFACV